MPPALANAAKQYSYGQGISFQAKVQLNNKSRVRVDLTQPFLTYGLAQIRMRVTLARDIGGTDGD
jgi:hypothetical protein